MTPVSSSPSLVEFQAELVRQMATVARALERSGSDPKQLELANREFERLLAGMQRLRTRVT